MNDTIIKKVKDYNVDVFDENIYGENKKLATLCTKIENQEKELTNMIS